MTYGFAYSGDGGRSFNQVSAGLSAEDVLLHIQSVAGERGGVRLEHADHDGGVTTVYAIGRAWRWFAQR